MPQYHWIRYGILVLAAAALIAGSSLLTDILDPFSIAGRIFTDLLRPLVIGGNNALAYALESAQIYTLYPAETSLPALSLVLPVAAIALTVGWLAFTRGRLYCNLVCPVGAALGLISRLAVFKVAIDEHDCTGCGLCEKVCKGGCIDRKAKTLDFDRCVGCFNCFDACPRDGMMFRTPWKRAVRTPVGPRKDRREFVSRVAGMMLLGSLLGDVPAKKIIPTKLTKVPTGSALPVSPPGSRGLGHFTATCTACHLCVSACPSRVLQPSFLEYGIAGILQPRMDYRTAYCNYECTVCGEICPSGAILAIPREQKKLTQLGLAKFVKDNCIVNTEHTDCGACSEHCPTKAVTMIPFEGKLVIPEVRTDYCIGCGACEHACPTKPYKAIFVESNAVHHSAKKPPEQKLQQPAVPQEDFPF
jgi:ferredoxin